jgi:lipoprotein-releasing system ATP-binding protein
MSESEQDASRLEPWIVEPPDAVLRAVGLSKTYTTGRGQLDLFRELDLTVHAGEMVAIVGESGAGKSSLLHLLAALDRPTTGEVWCGESRLSQFTARQAAEFRNRDVGYVWQFHYLLPEFTALENVAMPLLARGDGRSGALAKARRWLAEVGLAEREDHEPTGDLDGKTADVVFDLIQRLHTAHGLTSVLVTHNLEFAGRCDRMLRLRDGHLIAGNIAAS